MAKIPVFVVHGFLESGKTQFAMETLSDEYFSDGERNLVIACEEGIEEYEDEVLQKSNTTLVMLEDKSEFNEMFLAECQKKYKPTQVIVEYCVCKGSKSIHYIRKVGLAWAEAGISTVGQAKERTTTYRRNTFAIMKAFGINDRNPVDPELSYIEKWLNTYDFTLDLVLEACRRTMERLHKPNFEYADRILTRWSDQKVHNMNDVLALDQEHQKKAARRAPASQARSTGFTNFQQRDYDFDELEKQLLESQH